LLVTSQGMDYIFIIPAGQVDDICSTVIKVFDQLIPFTYAAEDRKRGFIKSVNRRGEANGVPYSHALNRGNHQS